MTTERKSDGSALPDSVTQGVVSGDRGSGKDLGEAPRGTGPVKEPLSWANVTDQDIDDIFGYEGPNGWIDSKIESTAEQRAAVESLLEDPEIVAAIASINAIAESFGDSPRPSAASALNESQVTYPEGWWVPAQRSWQMAVRGSPEMTAAEYRNAFLGKLVGLMEIEGKDQARATILSFFDPYNRAEYFPEDEDLWDWAEALTGLLAFPLASPEDSAPADADEAQSAVEAQDELSLSEVLSAGVA